MYVKLARQGHRIDVVPEYLFYYRHRPASLLRTTDAFLNRRRVLRQFFPSAELPAAEQIQLWTALASFDEQHRLLQLAQNPDSVATTASDHVAIISNRRAPRIKRTGVRLAAYNFKQVIRKTTNYHTIFEKLKSKRAA